MEVINNVSKKLNDDLKEEIKSDSRLSIAAACFSIYAFEELRKELEGIEELRFIFTSPPSPQRRQAKKGKNSTFHASTENGASQVQSSRSS